MAPGDDFVLAAGRRAAAVRRGRGPPRPGHDVDRRRHPRVRADRPARAGQLGLAPPDRAPTGRPKSPFRLVSAGPAVAGGRWRACARWPERALRPTHPGDRLMEHMLPGVPRRGAHAPGTPGSYTSSRRTAFDVITRCTGGIAVIGPRRGRRHAGAAERRRGSGAHAPRGAAGHAPGAPRRGACNRRGHPRRGAHARRTRTALTRTFVAPRSPSTVCSGSTRCARARRRRPGHPTLRAGRPRPVGGPTGQRVAARTRRR